MKCQLCGQRTASVHFTELSGGDPVEYYICDECAKAKGLSKTDQGEAKFKVGDFLAGMSESDADSETASLACETCGKTYGEFRETSRLGCADCYTFFGTQLTPLLRRIHGSTLHTGKLPSGGGFSESAAAELMRLRKELKRALEEEQFERCAELRDRIRKAETGDRSE